MKDVLERGRKSVSINPETKEQQAVWSPSPVLLEKGREPPPKGRKKEG